jgi:hypothetical protein
MPRPAADRRPVQATVARSHVLPRVRTANWAAMRQPSAQVPRSRRQHARRQPSVGATPLITPRPRSDGRVAEVARVGAPEFASSGSAVLLGSPLAANPFDCCASSFRNGKRPFAVARQTSDLYITTGPRRDDQRHVLPASSAARCATKSLADKSAVTRRISISGHPLNPLSRPMRCRPRSGLPCLITR